MIQDYRKIDAAQIEAIEKQTLIAICHALQQYSKEAKFIFESAPADSEAEVIVVTEDIVQYAIEVAEIYAINQRFAGFTDYKRVRWMPTNFGLFPQALLVDAKASKEDHRANLQQSQLPMDAEFHVREKDGNIRVARLQSGLPPHLDVVMKSGTLPAATTSIFVHLHYKNLIKPTSTGPFRELIKIIAICVPHRMLKQIYNPNPSVSFWRKGKESTGRGEKERIRLSFEDLGRACRWRYQVLEYKGGSDGYTVPVWRDNNKDGLADDRIFNYVGR